jgi:hypothetical protein
VEGRRRRRRKRKVEFVMMVSQRAGRRRLR